MATLRQVRVPARGENTRKSTKIVKVEYSTLTVLRQSRIFYFDAKASKYDIIL